LKKDLEERSLISLIFESMKNQNSYLLYAPVLCIRQANC